jgi:hypothetical protein
MKTTLFILLVLCCLAALPALAQSSDVTGDWDMRILTQDGGEMMAIFKLKSENGKVAGTIVSEGKATIEEGSVDGKQLRLKVKYINEENATMFFSFTAEVNGDEMKGNIVQVADTEPMKLSFTAKRSKK